MTCYWRKGNKENRLHFIYMHKVLILHFEQCLYFCLKKKFTYQSLVDRHCHCDTSVRIIFSAPVTEMFRENMNTNFTAFHTSELEIQTEPIDNSSRSLPTKSLNKRKNKTNQSYCVNSRVAFLVNVHTFLSASSFGMSEGSSYPIKYNENFIAGKSSLLSNLEFKIIHNVKIGRGALSVKLGKLQVQFLHTSCPLFWCRNLGTSWDLLSSSWFVGKRNPTKTKWNSVHMCEINPSSYMWCLIGVCRTLMWSTRPVFRNWQFAHSESHWIVFNVNMTSWCCDITWRWVFANTKKTSHRNYVFVDTSNLW